MKSGARTVTERAHADGPRPAGSPRRAAAARAGAIAIVIVFAVAAIAVGIGSPNRSAETKTPPPRLSGKLIYTSQRSGDNQRLIEAIYLEER